MMDYDRYITNSRYNEVHLFITCNSCGETFHGMAITEYGMTEIGPEECPGCGRDVDPTGTITVEDEDGDMEFNETMPAFTIENAEPEDFDPRIP